MIVAGVLLLSIAVALLNSERLPILIIGLFGAGIITIALLREPAIGLAMLIVGSLVVPFEIQTGTSTSLNPPVMLLTALIGLWVLAMVLRRDIRLLSSRPILPLLLFSGVAILSFGTGNLPWQSFAQTAPIWAQLGGLAIFLLSAGAFLLSAHQIKKLRWLKLLTWLFLGLGALFILGWFVPGLSGIGGLRFHHRATGSLFWTWLVAIAFSQAVFNKRLRRGWRMAIGGLLVATLYVGMGRNSAWTSGWLPALVSVVVILWVGAPRIALPVTIGAGLIAVFNLGNVIDVLLIGGNEYSLLTRIEAWQIVAEISRSSPLLGLGPANYYWYTPLYPILGWSVNFSSHNQFVDIVAQTGLLGLALFLWFMLEVSRVGWRLRKKAAEGFSLAYTYGALGGLAGTLAAAMLADWVIPFVYNIRMSGFRASVLGWIFLGGLIALENITFSKGIEGGAETV